MTYSSFKTVSPTLLLLVTEVLVDLTDGPPPQKKFWPEIKEAGDAPTADAKAKAKADKEKKKKLIDVRIKFYQFVLILAYILPNAKLQPCVKRLKRVFGGLSCSLGAVPKNKAIL